MGPRFAIWTTKVMYEGSSHDSGALFTSRGSCTYIPLTPSHAPIPKARARASTINRRLLNRRASVMLDTLARLDWLDNSMIISRLVNFYKWKLKVSTDSYHEPVETILSIVTNSRLSLMTIEVFIAVTNFERQVITPMSVRKTATAYQLAHNLIHQFGITNDLPSSIPYCSQ